MKNTLYFPHDYHARHDPKLDRLYLTLGYEGVGIYWCLIEMLYEQGGYLKFDDLILYARQDNSLCERIAKVVRGFDLFKFDDVRFWSESCLNRLGKIKDKCEKASQSALKRWGGNANAMPTQCEGNAINKRNKEKKETNTYVDEFFSYFLLKTKKKFALIDSRRSIIEARLKTHTIDQLKQAVDNFVKDTWVDRHKFIDIVYCIGIRNKVDNLEKWLNIDTKKEYKQP